MPTLVTDFIVSLGLFFVLFNLALDLLYPIIDARLRKDNQDANTTEPFEFSHAVAGIWHAIRGVWFDLLGLFHLREKPEMILPAFKTEHFSASSKDDTPAFKRPGLNRVCFGLSVIPLNDWNNFYPWFPGNDDWRGSTGKR